MATEVWFRNPHNYARELAEGGGTLVAWDRGLLQKRRIDPVAHASLFFPEGVKYRILMIGEQGSAEIGVGHTLENPIAVYPTWAYGEDQALLEEMVSSPVGEDPECYEDMTVELDQRAVRGQEHRVVIIEPPNAGMLGGKAFYRYLKQLQEDYPGCIIHLHGSYSFQMCFGMGLRAADVDPRTPASKGKLTLPSGQTIPFEGAMSKPKWFSAMGLMPVDMKVPRNRCIYNIRASLWAGKNYAELNSFRVKSHSNVDTESSDGEYKPKLTTYQRKALERAEGDMVTCNTCTLASSCKYERADSVCSVPGAEMSQLGKYFKTRDSGSIMDGLSELMDRNAGRLESSMAAEEDMGELDPEVTKLMNQLFEQGVKLAKLVDPSLRGAKVAVNVLNSGGGPQAQIGNPREMIAGAIRELERQGIPRKDITPKMIEGLLSGMVDPSQASRAIEGTVIASELDD